MLQHDGGVARMGIQHRSRKPVSRVLTHAHLVEPLGRPRDTYIPGCNTRRAVVLNTRVELLNRT